jgi:CHAT domain-containing protein
VISPAIRISRRTAFLIAIAVLAVVGWFAGGAKRVAALRARIAVERLAQSAPDRLPEARFTALPAVARVHAETGAMRGRDSNVALQARVSEVVNLAGDETPGTAAAALAMSRKWPDAVALLEAAVVEYPNDASLWSDLAAARYERSIALEDSASLLHALVAADRSRRIDPQLANALFNRALVLERLGLSTVAAAAWRECAASGDASVSAEARRRLEIPATNFAAGKDEFDNAAIRGDAATVERMVDKFPQEARTWGDVIYLTHWANAYLAGNAAEATKQLTITRAAGTALRPRGETLLSEVVALVDATTDARELCTFAIAQQAYDEGRTAFSEDRNADAERLFGQAAHGYARAHSPMQFVARAYAASAIFEQERTQEAHEMLIAMIAEARTRSGHRGLLAMLLWIEGRCELGRGRWQESIDALREARAIYAELGETKNAGAMENILAEEFELIGRVDLAWPHCMASFRSVSDQGNLYRLQVAIAGGVRLAMGTHDWDLAASLLEAEMSVASELRKPSFAADAHRRLFLVENERNDIASRDAALGRARVAAAHAGDESQERLAEIDQAEAVVAMQSNPERAVALLTRALESAESTDRRKLVADLLWNRGRAHLAAKNADAARADFLAGIAELERQRGLTATEELRARFFDASEGLFDDAIGLLVQRSEARAAFELADRARARLLLDERRAESAALAERIGDAVLLEFAVLEHEVVLFRVRGDDVAAHRLDLTPEVLHARVDELHRRIAAGTALEVRDVSGPLYETLFAPVREELATARSLILVPDGELQRLPFGALWSAERQQYLAQWHALAIAPSAALLTKPIALPRAKRSLLIGSASGDEAESLAYLPQVHRELASLQRVYDSSRVITGRDASKARFIAEAPLHDVIHFAGHGLSSDDSITASLLFARDGSDSGRMYMSDIAKLRLPRAPLVVLAACGTLRGRAAGLEGMPSLARSFLSAGASTVVGTMWDVDDARAGALLVSFHRAIAAGVAPSVALQEAQGEAIARGGEDAHPKNWAQYVIYTAMP